MVLYFWTYKISLKFSFYFSSLYFLVIFKKILWLYKKNNKKTHIAGSHQDAKQNTEETYFTIACLWKSYIYLFTGFVKLHNFFFHFGMFLSSSWNNTQSKAIIFTWVSCTKTYDDLIHIRSLWILFLPL